MARQLGATRVNQTQMTPSANLFRMQNGGAMPLNARLFGNFHNNQQSNKGSAGYFFSASILGAGLAGYVYLKNKDAWTAHAQATEGMKLVEIDFASDLHDGDMRELKVGDGKQDKVLISRVKGEIHAVGAFCSHFGLPLS